MRSGTGASAVARASGKLYLAGEHAVVEPRGRAIVAAIDHGVVVTARVAPDAEHASCDSAFYADGRIFLARSSNSSTTRFSGPKQVAYIEAALNATAEYLHSLGVTPLTPALSIESQLSGAFGKYGLGSSGAITAATVNSYLSLHSDAGDIPRSDEVAPRLVMQLALLATIRVAPSASGGDLAASIYGGVIGYRSPDRALLRRADVALGVAGALQHSAWFDLETATLPTFESLGLSVAVVWTGRQAVTSALVDAVAHFRRTDRWQAFTEASADVVESMERALGAGDARGVLDGIRRNRALLAQLGHDAGVDLETSQLRTAIDIAEAHGAAAKFSGAGGGDCAVAILEPARIPELQDAWRDAGLEPLAIAVGR